MAEGAPLLREYTLTGIEGSNPSLTAINKNPGLAPGFLFMVMGGHDENPQVRQIAIEQFGQGA